MAKLLLDELLMFSRKAVLNAVSRAMQSGKSATPASGSGSGEEAAPWPVAVDGTAGNGVDTEFLAQAVEEAGLVLAFDVQSEAIAATTERLEKSGVSSRVRLIKDNHDRVRAYLPKEAKVLAAMYNLGFLPGGSPDVTTLPESTVASLEALQEVMAPGGVISVHCYTGQDNGLEELAAVEAWASRLSWPEWRVLRYEFCNKKTNREVLFLAHCV
ncbi:class I SAM-dependent methyltransferase [Desulfovibrio sp. OttesenSCG-928-C06]|nr:class I SAM-dependent methyltransferase [Desulfovibrio sp. OttesenSCG-928-C06]